MLSPRYAALPEIGRDFRRPPDEKRQSKRTVEKDSCRFMVSVTKTGQRFIAAVPTFRPCWKDKGKEKGDRCISIVLPDTFCAFPFIDQRTNRLVHASSRWG